MIFVFVKKIDVCVVVDKSVSYSDFEGMNPFETKMKLIFNF